MNNPQRFFRLVALCAFAAVAVIVSWNLIAGWAHNHKLPESKKGPQYSYNPRPCPDSWDKEIHLERSRVRYFDMDPPLGCKSGAIYPPGVWFRWEHALTGDTNGCVVFLQYEGLSPWGPFTIESFPERTPDTYSRALHVERAAGTDACKVRLYVEEWRNP